ncbi:MAG: hypothetical protein WDA27_13970 [Actinomycetota bacterium]
MRRIAGCRSWAVAVLTVTLASLSPARAGIPPVPVQQGPASSETFYGAPAIASPVHAPAVPQNPYMALNERSNLHVDAYMTDTNPGPGPLGKNMEVRSTFHVGECATVTFDSQGRIVTVCVGVEGPRLTMIDPDTLETLALMPLPPRNPAGATTFLSDISGGGYFYLDNLDRAVIPTNDRRIFVVGETTGPAGLGFEIARMYDVSPALASDDKIMSVLPDWSGRLWFASAAGTVGVVDPQTGDTAKLDTGEAIGNSFAVDETGGVYIVTARALYRFDADADGKPVATWREAYDYGVRFKPGQLNFGSGTTPSLMGPDLVAITDNADPRMHVMVYRRAAQVGGDRFVCEEPVFAQDKGATDQSLIVTGDSIVVVNNYGYSGPASVTRGGSSEPGLTRIDVDRDAKTCTTKWESQERGPSLVPKLSLATGLVYTYTKPAGATDDPWYLTALDFRTGETVFRQLVGTGLGFNNNWSPVTFGPDGTAYVGVLGGLVLLRDTA